MMTFLASKGLRAEVTEGIDLEYGVTLSGDRISIGTGPGDDLRLGAGDVVPGHLTFERRTDGGWDYFTSDLGLTEVDRGNPRTGKARAGMWFRLGGETRIDLARCAAAPVAPAESGAEEGPKTVPLAIALPLMAAMAGGAIFFMLAAGSGERGPSGLRTAPFVTGAADLEPALETCLATSRTPGRAVAASDPASPYWRVMAFRDTDPAAARLARADLDTAVREILADAFLLARENRYLDASSALRRMENVLPVGTARCPILTASRFDLALLEVSASN